MKSFLVVCFILFFTSTGFAVPSIVTVNGEYSNGSTITISGSGFGSKSTATPIISSYDNATTADNFSSGSISGAWHTQGAPTLSTANKRTAFPQSSYGIRYDAAGAYDVIGYNYGSRSDVAYVSWWTYNDYSTFHGSSGNGNAKWMRLYTSNGDGNGMVYSNLWDASSNFSRTYGVPEYAPSCSGWSVAYTGTGATLSASAYFRVDFGDADQDSTMQEWVHWEQYNIYSTSLESGNDTAILLKNGETVFRAVNVSLQKSDSNDDVRWLRLGQVSGGRSVEQIEYVDQIYFDNTISHVFISANSTTTWPDVASPVHTETLVCSSWADSSITCKVNQGSFADNSTVYLYVVDKNGDCNKQGYLLTISGNGGGAILPPSVYPPTTNN